MIKDSKRIVFKFGTNTLLNSKGEAELSRIQSFIEDIVSLKKKGKEVIVVSSGAIKLGAKTLNLTPEQKSVYDKQAFASVGQSHIMRIWEEGFEKENIRVAQILLTEEDFSNRRRYLNLRSTLSTLLEYKVVPVINQNDAVCPSEIEDEYACFSDNDKLSAIVAGKLDADLLVIISDINGLYDKNPKENPDAKLVEVVEKITKKIEKMATGASSGGRGGMITKLRAAKIANHSGANMIIASGKIDHIIKKVFDQDPDTPKTVFLAGETLSSKKRWIAYASNIMGKMTVNECAKKVLLQNQKSLLAVGIVNIEGEFSRGDVVCVCDEEGNVIAHGITNYDSTECRKIMGHHSSKIEEILGGMVSNDVINKDNLVLV